ncbi:hypothetical protein [uncultured Chryseobacterium sp.]|uniref:hypothetical protein n=1 Tax=uncultured Chryseobacterium sp. TaxID=259322 RepID=UPI002600B2AC|nr:hypothetical protein [uncultured Chryseobacterium sp.]
MKKFLFTGLLSVGLLLPASISATTHDTGSKTELSSKKPRKGRKSSRSKNTKSYSSARVSRAYSPSSNSCNYNGHQLYTGERGGCYYYSGNSKKYVDRAYCSGCN